MDFYQLDYNDEGQNCGKKIIKNLHFTKNEFYTDKNFKISTIKTEGTFV